MCWKSIICVVVPLFEKKIPVFLLLLINNNFPSILIFIIPMFIPNPSSIKKTNKETFLCLQLTFHLYQLLVGPIFMKSSKRNICHW